MKTRCLILIASVALAFAAEDGPAILGKRCGGCHNSQAKVGGLDLTSLASARVGGAKGAAIIPGQADESLLYRRIREGSMPPSARLPPAEQEALRQWIDRGAKWDKKIDLAGRRAGYDWWSLQPLRKIPPDASIDSLVRAKLAEKKLTTSPSADRRTLIRRATFDLLGLPPTPAEVESFVDDPDPNAYEKLIDRLLASPHYGERWGRHWLDVARFGESNGYEQNHLRPRAWHYRDYVIRGFNQDKPFSQMVREQLAGDQIAPGDPEVEAATGFLVAGVHDTVTIQNTDGEMLKRANDMDDIITATAAGFLGLTVNCARCHDHKFDPIEQADYYRLAAVFSGVQHGERPLVATTEKEKLEKPLKESEAVLKDLESTIASFRKEMMPRVEAAQPKIEAAARPAVAREGTEEKFAPVEAKYLRMNIEASAGGGNAQLDELEIFSGVRNVALASNGATVEAVSRVSGEGKSHYPPTFVIDGKYAERWFADSKSSQLTVAFAKQERIERIFFSKDRPLGDARTLTGVPTLYSFEASLDGKTWRKIADSEGRLPYSPKDREDYFLLAVLDAQEKKQWDDWQSKLTAVKAKIAKMPKVPVSYIGSFSQPKEPTYLHKGGNPSNRGADIAPASLTTLSKLLPGFSLDMSAPEGERRLALANWIVDERNALTARVLANRMWHYHFGRALAGTPSDLGKNGEPPSNPDLLDYLAGRIHTSSWKLKALHREVMLSETYQQSSETNQANAAVDADAVFLWRFPPRRLEAEAIRDSVLAVSGKLNPKVGGPGFQLYQYTVDNVATYLPKETHGPETYRRTVYHQSPRSVRVDVLGAYDCPDPSLPEPKRVVTTTALQALSLLNNSFLMEQSDFFAERLRKERNTARAQVDLAFELTFGRMPTEVERTAAFKLIDQHGLTIFCRALFNANEFVYVF